MRIGFARHCIRPRPLRCATSRKPRNREIEAAPEKVNRAALSNETTAELLEYGVDGYQDAPESVRIFRIVRFVDAILGKRDWVRHLIRRGMDLYVQAERVERAHDIIVEIRDSSWGERQPLG